MAYWAQAVSSYCPYIHAHMPSHTHRHTYIYRNIHTLSEHRVKLRQGTELPLSGAHRDLPVAALGILTNSHIA